MKIKDITAIASVGLDERSTMISSPSSQALAWWVAYFRLGSELSIPSITVPSLNIEEACIFHKSQWGIDAGCKKIIVTLIK